MGVRSAVFCPLENIGLIILDEEHDSSYKQHDGVRYHAKHIAEYISHKNKSTMILGSATPSLESYHEGSQNNELFLNLNSRVAAKKETEIEIVDLKKSFSPFGDKGLVSKELREALQDTLENNHQAIVFLNRRGFAPMIMCTGCGDSLKCSSCSVSLSYHKNTNTYECHYCNYQILKQSKCPECKTGKLLHLGLGTEAIEQELTRYFPDANVKRMDKDCLLYTSDAADE